jgi:hypothetical protein
MRRIMDTGFRHYMDSTGPGFETGSEMGGRFNADESHLTGI